MNAFSASIEDLIEKHILLSAPPERVWQAIGDAATFGRWFGARLEGGFAEGARIAGVTAATTVDADVAAVQARHAGTAFAMIVEGFEPRRALAFRWWIPGAAADGVPPDARLERLHFVAMQS